MVRCGAVRCGALVLSSVVSYGAVDGTSYKTPRYFAVYHRPKPYPGRNKNHGSRYSRLHQHMERRAYYALFYQRTCL